MKSYRVLVFSGLLLLVSFLAGCGGGGSSNNNNPTQPLMITTTSPLPQATINNAYTATLSATGGTGTYTWGVAGGSLPPGVTLNMMTAMVMGTPTAAGTFNFTAQVTDGAGHVATANLQLIVEGALQLTCDLCATGTMDLPAGAPGVPYNPSGSPTFSASGGTAPYTWCVVESSGTCDNGSGGALPPGLTISTQNNNGVISGTPSGQPAVPVTFTVQVKDSETIPASGSAPFTLTIFSITTKTLPHGIINQPYKAANGQPVELIVAGGDEPYTWCVLNSAGNCDPMQSELPPGLTLGPCVLKNPPMCAITGTPTQLGLSNFTVQVTDGEKPPAVATAMLSIDVQDPTLRITTSSLPNGYANLPYNVALQSTGGNGNNTWSIVAGSGSLPAGLTLNSTTGAISGTPTAQGTSSFIVQVQDTENPPQIAMSQTLSITVNAPVGNSLLTGQFAIAFSGYNSGTPFLLSASLAADGNGNITSGDVDHNDGHGSEINDPSQCTGNPNCPIAEVVQSGSVYDLSAGNGLGTMTIMTLDANNSPHTYKFEISVSPNACTPGQPSLSACGQLIQRDPNNPQTYGSGVLKIQDQAYFQVNAFFPGNFAVLLNGIDTNGHRYAAAGAVGTNPTTRVDVDCNGNGWHLSGCPLNQNDNGSPAVNPIAGSQFSATIDPLTGRGQFVNLRFPQDPNGFCPGGMNGPNCGYVYYLINEQEMILMSTDPLSKPANLTLWSAYRQKSFARGWGLEQLNGPVLTELTANDNGNSDVMAGLFNADGNGNATYSADENDNGTLSQPSATGTYAVATNGNLTGNYTLSFAQEPALNNASVYLYTGGFGYFVGSDAKGTSGVLEQQSGSPFSNASVIGLLEGGTLWPAVTGVTNSVTQLFADGGGNIAGTQYTSGPSGPGGPTQLTLTYSVDSTGRAVVNQNGNEYGVLYVIGPNKFVLVPTGSNPALSIFISGQAD